MQPMALNPFETVFQEYIPSSTEIVDGKSQRRRVSLKQEKSVDVEIRKTLPALLSDAIKNSGHAVEDFEVYGSVGQIAKIP